MDLRRVTEAIDKARTWLYRTRRKLATVAVAALACWVAVHVVMGDNGMLTYLNKRAEARSLEQEIRGLEAENQRISAEINALKSDPQRVEKEAREQLRYAKPGEVVYTLPEPKRAPDNAAAQKR
jgi:cell division protein FtsB